MFEKIGLPPKPSMRGGTWVVDASHCQGCSAQFTFINRKHHCRRCGGLFCNSCTQQRMVLRGQGDSPVRICNPCKNIEDAARLELRYGHKNRAAKGASKQLQKQEEEILHQIIGADAKQESRTDMISDLLRTGSSSSSSSLIEEPSTLGSGGDFQIDSASSTPEELRQQAAEEKKKYKILKGEGKSEEALQAFKRSKELERQAGALEIALRKNRRMSSMSNSIAAASKPRKDESEESLNIKKVPSHVSKEAKNDLAADLRELGWSDADLHDTEKKPVNLSLEGELSNLLREIPQSSSVNRKSGTVDKSPVLALKKKALQLKREGKIAEAKEELKRAKILDKQLEEQELLGADEDSDDELSVLIRNMDDDKHDDILLDHARVPGMNFENFLGLGDDITVDDNFDVSDNDMNDPELAAALKSFGWTEEDDEQATDHVLEPKPLDREAMRHQMQSLKLEALSQKRAGNVAEAMSLLKKANLLEKDLDAMPLDVQSFSPEVMAKGSVPQLSPEGPGHQALHAENVRKLPVKSKLAIQRELLALKKKALALRREGRAEEADEELKKGKALEQQLEEMENASKSPASRPGMPKSELNHMPVRVPGVLDLGEEVAEAEVTEQDMHDPALMSVLKNLGWDDADDSESLNLKSNTLHEAASIIPRRSKKEIQHELLGIKRKALALRRQGKTEEADEELERARELEKQLADAEAFESSKYTAVHLVGSHDSGPQDKYDTVPEADREFPLLSVGRKLEKEETDLKGDNESEPLPICSISAPRVTRITGEPFKNPAAESEAGSTKSLFGIAQSDSMGFLSNNGSGVPHSSVERSKGEHPCADELYLQTASIQPSPQKILQQDTTNESKPVPKSASPNHSTACGADAQNERVLAHKLKAVALKREGKLAEAKEELRRAKLLDQTLRGQPQQSEAGKKDASASASEPSSTVEENRTNHKVPKPLSGRDRFKLQQKSLDHKRNALKLRREGKIEESEAEFALAKELESQLEAPGSQGLSNSADSGMMGGMGDVGVEDLFDPQLLSALKSIGWDDNDLGTQPSMKSEPKPNADQSGNLRQERTQLEEAIKAERVKALTLKREGKQGEALESLRSAKRLQKKLDLLD